MMIKVKIMVRTLHQVKGMTEGDNRGVRQFKII